MKDKKRIFVDIDGTLTIETEGYGDDVYAERTPHYAMISAVNKLYDEGHYITLYTSRYAEDIHVTIEWCKKHGVQFHELNLNKPKYDLFIDDKVQNVRDFLESQGI